MTFPVAILGNGGAAAEAVVALRAQGYGGELHLFSENSRPPYNPMLGTYLISGAIPLERAYPFGDDGFYAANRVAAHLGQAVVVLDALAQTLTIADGTTFGYERCLVATGARPTVPPVPGLREAVAGTSGPERRAFTLRSLDDALALKEVLGRLCGRGRRRPRVALVGASFVGLKLAEVLHEMGVQVLLVEREAHILPRSAHPECAAVMEDHLREHGHELRLGADLLAVETGPNGLRLRLSAAPNGAVPEESSAGGVEEVDLVVVCTGIRPSLDFLLPGQIETAPGIIVDEQMRSSVPTLYAAGDVAQGMNLLSGRSEIIALWASARYQGRAAGRNLAGAPGGYRGSVPSSISHVGTLLFASVGELDNYDDMTMSRDGCGFQLRTWRNGSLVGVNMLDCCLSAGSMRQALLKATTGVAAAREATWTSFNG